MAIEDFASDKLKDFPHLEAVLLERKDFFRHVFDYCCRQTSVPYPERITEEHAWLLDYAPGIARNFYGDEAAKEAVATVGRGLFFGMAMRSALAKSQGLSAIRTDTVQHFSDEGKGIANELVEKTTKYMGGRPKLRNFVERYLPLVSPNPNFIVAARASSRLMLWEHEDFMFGGYVALKIRAYSSEIEKDADLYEFELPSLGN
jgi:hypothetical protein